ncbi:MAG TPA: exodeoxyribonuclease VII large subunit [Candidatus Binataceae bacterium]|nr:exodeoxyribonuclease VII large subunit [Candidatus Binataceae bacterium]
MAGQLEFALRETPRRVALNVTQLVRAVRETLEVNLGEYWVVGEVSNARLAPSNHLYFTLKDSRSAISVVMFSTAARRLRFSLENGMQVLVRGRVNLYEARGTLQLYAEELEPRGLGALQAAFEQLKQRLSGEGLFDPERKRPLPLLPRSIGIVTALGGAALYDMLRVLFDRFPNLHVIVRPALIQGPKAAAEIAAALDDLSRDARAEVIIVGRGGGSLEDLWPFNEEVVARAIRRSAVPVISAVGHEIDYTIADFAADLRAPTPTAAAQLVVPVKDDLRRRLDELGAAMAGSMRLALAAHRRHFGQLEARLRDPQGLIRQIRQRVDEAAADLSRAIAIRLAASRSRLHEMRARLRSPAALAREQRLRLAMDSARLTAVMRVRLEVARARLAAEARRLDAISPLRVLERGYAVVTDPRDGRVVTDAGPVALGDELILRLARGRLRAAVIQRDP